MYHFRRRRDRPTCNKPLVSFSTNWDTETDTLTNLIKQNNCKLHNAIYSLCKVLVFLIFVLVESSLEQGTLAKPGLIERSKLVLQKNACTLNIENKLCTKYVLKATNTTLFL